MHQSPLSDFYTCQPKRIFCYPLAKTGRIRTDQVLKHHFVILYSPSLTGWPRIYFYTNKSAWILRVRSATLLSNARFYIRTAPCWRPASPKPKPSSARAPVFSEVLGGPRPSWQVSAAQNHDLPQAAPLAFRTTPSRIRTPFRWVRGRTWHPSPYWQGDMYNNF